MLPEYSLEGKTSIVTGSGKGIALTLAEAGADIVSVDKAAEDNERVAEEIRKLGRAAQPREIGLLAVYLASAASDMVTGQNIYIDGGLTSGG